MQTRALAWAGRVFGSSTVLPIIVRQETREVGSYLRLARSSHQPSTQAAAMAIATESAEHAQHLSESMGRTGEPWHATTDSGYLRSVIYGFNDGLAAKSEAEVAARQIAVEKEEIRLMPDLEEQELAIILEMKGLAPDRARETAHVMMADPQQALDTKVQEEPGIQPPSVTPLTDGLVTGTTPAFGAMIPLVPFLVLDSGLAIWVSLAVAMLAHFAVGAARSVFTGRGFWTSGRDMFLVGFGVAAAGYLIGGLLMTS
jgi:VIT1/CCC1 family predicted Fe2+/Mn2+ transporter